MSKYKVQYNKINKVYRVARYTRGYWHGLDMYMYTGHVSAKKKADELAWQDDYDDANKDEGNWKDAEE